MYNYETVKKGTKKGLDIMYSSLHNVGTTLDDVYKSYSRAKERIYDNWAVECLELNGYNFHISSRNTMMYTIGFETDTHYYYITPSHNYRVLK